VKAIEAEIDLLKRRVAKLERSVPACVPVTTLAPEPYEILQPFHAVIRSRGSEYVASFLEANLSATGGTQEEAVWNLKDTVVAAFDMLASHDATALGPGPARQLSVLRQFVRRTG
jgi:hypothetical protein